MRGPVKSSAPACGGESGWAAAYKESHMVTSGARENGVFPFHANTLQIFVEPFESHQSLRDRAERQGSSVRLRVLRVWWKRTYQVLARRRMS